MKTLGRKTRLSPGLVAAYLFIAVMCIASIVPFMWTFFGATHDSTQLWQREMMFAFGGNLLQNYRDLLSVTNIWRNMFNSVLIAAVYTVIVCLIDSMAGYAFAKFNFKGRDQIFFVCMCGMFIPASVTMIPLYMMSSNMGIVDTPWAVILPSAATIFGVFFMRQSIMEFPTELLESARIDGAGEARIFFRIVAPNLKPAFTSLIILSIVQRWGDYLWPMIVLHSGEQQTLPVALALMITPGTAIKYGAVLLGAVIALAPILILFLILQKNFIAGIMSGAVKG